MSSNLICAEVQFLCVVLLSILLKFNLEHNTGENKVFDDVRLMYVLAIVSSIADILRNVLHFITAVHLFNVIYYCAFSAIGFCWLNYCTKNCTGNVFKSKVYKVLSLIPLSMTGLSVIFSVFNSCIYYVDVNGALGRGEYFNILLVNFLYVVMPFIMPFFSKEKFVSDSEKSDYYKMVFSSLPVLIIGGIQVIFLPKAVAVMSFCIIMSLVVLFINAQYKKILTDNLTKLPNRYGMDEEIHEQLMQYKRDKNDSFYIIVCDLDDFKSINDTWGHQEGDRALKLIAGVLIRAAEKNNSMAFRIGGDEFVIITDTSEYGIAEKICDDIKTSLTKVDFRDDYIIKMSMGIKLYDATMTISQLINTADKELYEVKRSRKGE